MTIGFKETNGKTNPLLVFGSLAEALAVVNRVRDYGVAKYNSTEGWKEVPDAQTEYRKAQLRHMNKEIRGEEFDGESGLLHLAHEATNTLFLLQMKIEELIFGADMEAPHGGDAMMEALLTYNPPPKVFVGDAEKS